VVTVLDSGDSIYQLDIRKQPGMKDESLKVSVTLPDGATVFEATPAPTTVDGTRIYFELNLNANQIVAIRYR
jgi:hypothetical protein